MESTVEPNQQDLSILCDDPKDILAYVPTGALRQTFRVTSNR